MNTLDARQLTPVCCCLQHARRIPHVHRGVLTNDITEARQAAIRAVRSAGLHSAQVAGVAEHFFQKMLKLSDGSDLDYIMSVPGSTPQLQFDTSGATLTSGLQQEQCRQDAQSCVSQLLPRLEAMLGPDSWHAPYVQIERVAFVVIMQVIASKRASSLNFRLR